MQYALRRRVYISCILAGLFMILSRLVWMQLRSYDMAWDSKTLFVFQNLSPDRIQGCPEKDLFQQLPLPVISPNTRANAFREFSPDLFLRVSIPFFCQTKSPSLVFFNWQWIMVVGIILASVFSSRILTGSWVIALLTGAALLSRGSLLAQIGLFSADLSLTCLHSLLLCCLIHFLRTASPVSAILSSLSLISGSFLSEGFLMISLLIPPCMPFFFQVLTLSKNSKDLHRSSEAPAGRIFQPARSPASDWFPEIYGRRSLILWWIITAFFSLAVGLIGLPQEKPLPMAFPALENSHIPLTKIPMLLKLWLQLNFSAFDFHYGLSLFFILVFKIKASERLRWKLDEPLHTFLTLTILTACGALLLDLPYLARLDWLPENLRLYPLEMPLIRPSLIYFANWSEPAILTLGIVCFYHMLKKKPGYFNILKKRKISGKV